MRISLRYPNPFLTSQRDIQYSIFSRSLYLLQTLFAVTIVATSSSNLKNFFKGSVVIVLSLVYWNMTFSLMETEPDVSSKNQFRNGMPTLILQKYTRQYSIEMTHTYVCIHIHMQMYKQKYYNSGFVSKQITAVTILFYLMSVKY